MKNPLENEDVQIFILIVVLTLIACAVMGMIMNNVEPNPKNYSL